MPDPVPRRALLGGIGVLAVAGGLTTTAWSASAAPDSDRPGTDRLHPGTPDVVLATAATGKKLHFPNAKRLSDGTVYVVAREGADHTGQDGRIVALTSADGGRTWSTPTVVRDGRYDDRDPMITQLSTGRLLLSWFEIDWEVDPPDSRGTFVAHSDDLGRTWSDPVAVESMMSGESDIVDTYELGWNACHGQIKELADGELLIPLYGTTPDDRWNRATVVRSSDDGLTWNADSEAVIAAAEETHFQEPVLTVLPDGRIQVLLRIGASTATMSAGRSQESWSDDGGRTWSEPSELEIMTSSAHTEVLHDGRVFLAFGDLSGHFTSWRGTVGAVLTGDPGSWRDPAQELVWDSGTGDQANPAVVEVRPNRVLVIGFDSDSAELVGTFVRPNWFRPERPDPRRVDLAALLDDGRLQVSTDMTQRPDDRPGVGPYGAIDGTVGYYDAAWKAGESPGTYEIRFDAPVHATEVGVSLKPGHRAAATVEALVGDGVAPVASLDQRRRWGDRLEWFRLLGVIDGIRVVTEAAEGSAVLSELGLRAPRGRL